MPQSACEPIRFRCDDPTLDVTRVNSRTSRGGSEKAGLGNGDFLLSNARLRAVFDAIDHPHGLAPSGGALIDLEPPGGRDGLNQLFQAVGILPDDAVRYRSAEILDERPARVAVIYRGRLDGRPDIDVVTRFELRPCEPGIRLRSEIHHGGRDPLAVFVSDALFWGDRGHLPFTPGGGFTHPEIELEELGDAFVDVPFLTAAAPGTNRASYALVRCDAPSASGFHSSTLSAVGVERTILMPGDALAFERFVGVADGPGHAGAIGVASDVRRMLFGETYTELRGLLRDENAQPVDGSEERVAVLVEDAKTHARVAEAAPGPDGAFAVKVPAGHDYRLLVSWFGRTLEREFVAHASGSVADAGELTLPAFARVRVAVTSEAAPMISEVVVVPVDQESAERYAGSLFGEFAEPHCSPFLGPPHGASPACNRVLLGPDGAANFALPAGEFFVYATHGPFFTLARERVALEPGELKSLEFELEPISGLMPNGALSADLHVHGAASFDSSLPDRDRALSFVASDVPVIVATDHDVVTDYAKALAELGIADRVHVIPGAETTGQILFYQPPDSDIPKVIGHFNFWPLRRDAFAARGGLPHDERLEPGALFERMRDHYDGSGVAQLNHPYSEAPFGRDNGYLTAVGYDPRKPVPLAPNGTPEGELARRARGGTSNLDFDVQEVMNGASVHGFLGYRAAWFSFLKQGFVRAGTANSDSHTLAVELLGYPRTIVLGQGSLAEFDRERFDAAVRAGNSFGTNGPVLAACIEDGSNGCRPSSVESFSPAADAELHIIVAAAPWIPVDEARIYVNGTLVRTLPVSAHPDDPFGSSGTLRLETSVAVAELAAAAAARRDFWIVVEAGMALPFAADVNSDGLPDVTDNDGDGAVDLRDGLRGFREPGRVPQSNRRVHVQAIAPGVLPLAFANPFLIDRDGDGWSAPGLP